MNYLPRLLQMLQFREAIASVSLSHPETCECNICKAAKGDDDALVLFLAEREESSRTVGQVNGCGS